jgi:hypothetical protein
MSMACGIEPIIGGIIGGMDVAIIGTGPAPIPIDGIPAALDAYAWLGFTIPAGFGGAAGCWMKFGSTGGGGGTNTGAGGGGGVFCTRPSGVITDDVSAEMFPVAPEYPATTSSSVRAKSSATRSPPKLRGV